MVRLAEQLVGSCHKASAWACRVVRQRRWTSAARSASPAKKLSIFSCTLALVPKQVLAVTSSRAQSQIASSGVEVRAVTGQAHQTQPQVGRGQILPDRLPAVRRAIVPDHDQWLRMAWPATGARRPPRSPPCSSRPAPFSPPLPSPSRPPSSRWPSPPAGGWSNPPGRAPPAAPTCLAGRHRRGSGPHPRRRSWRQFASASARSPA